MSCDISQGEVSEVLKRTGVLLEGHFRLTSGRHSARYLQCAQVLQYPQEASRLAKALAGRFAKDQVDVVVGPAIGGIILAYEVARHLGARALFAERQDGAMALRRGFQIRPGERVLVVEDVITTGGSVHEVIRLVRDLGGQVVGVGVLVDRSDGQADFGYPLQSLLQIDITTYPPQDCLLCKQGLPAIKPGSRPEGCGQ